MLQVGIGEVLTEELRLGVEPDSWVGLAIASASPSSAQNFRACGWLMAVSVTEIASGPTRPTSSEASARVPSIAP